MERCITKKIEVTGNQDLFLRFSLFVFFFIYWLNKQTSHLFVWHSSADMKVSALLAARQLVLASLKSRDKEATVLQVMDKEMRLLADVFGQFSDDANVYVIPPDLSYFAYW